MAATPIYGKKLKNLLLQNQESLKAEYWYIASGTRRSCSNDDRRLKFDLFTARSNLHPYAFAVLALTAEFRKSQDFLILTFRSPGNQIVYITSKHLTPLFLNSYLWSKTAIFKLNNIQIILNSFYKWSDIFKIWESQTSWHWILEVPGQILGVSDFS